MKTKELTKQICKDIRDISTDDLKNIDVIIHLAALSNDPLGELNSNLTKEINFDATKKYLISQKNQKLKDLFMFHRKVCTEFQIQIMN